jgi:hypothetical protein
MFWKYHENDLFEKRFAFGKVFKKKLEFIFVIKTIYSIINVFKRVVLKMT